MNKINSYKIDQKSYWIIREKNILQVLNSL